MPSSMKAQPTAKSTSKPRGPIKGPFVRSSGDISSSVRITEGSLTHLQKLGDFGQLFGANALRADFVRADLHGIYCQFSSHALPWTCRSTSSDRAIGLRKDFIDTVEISSNGTYSPVVEVACAVPGPSANSLVISFMCDFSLVPRNYDPILGRLFPLFALNTKHSVSQGNGESIGIYTSIAGGQKAPAAATLRSFEHRMARGFACGESHDRCDSLRGGLSHQPLLLVTTCL